MQRPPGLLGGLLSSRLIEAENFLSETRIFALMFPIGNTTMRPDFLIEITEKERAMRTISPIFGRAAVWF
jgi:hypothetical protein